jgi:hypothetical protein
MVASLVHCEFLPSPRCGVRGGPGASWLTRLRVLYTVGIDLRLLWPGSGMNGPLDSISFDGLHACTSKLTLFIIRLLNYLLSSCAWRKSFPC